MENIQGQEIEQKCIEMFQNLGWEVLVNPHQKFDIELKVGGQTKGYVECVNYSSDVHADNLKNKIDKIKSIIEIEKPDIFVITNGDLFDVYYDGIFTATLSTPPSVHAYNTRRRLLAYYTKLNEVMKNE